LTLEEGTDRFFRNVGSYQSTLHNIPISEDINVVFLSYLTKDINALCGKNVEFANVGRGGIYSDHGAVKD
jgi:hypothetical protein